MDSINKSVASCIANSESSTIFSRLYEGAHNHTQTLTGTQSNTTNGASDKTSAGSSAPDPVPSNSSQPMLEAAMKATKISTRSCLKSAKRSPSPDGNVKPTTRASFVSDDALLTCMVTGAQMLPKVFNKERHEQFHKRADKVREQNMAAEEKARLLARAAGIEGSASGKDANDSDDDEVEPGDVFAQIIKNRLYEADVARRQLTMRAIASGAVDFALYVTRNQIYLEDLEDMIEYYGVAVLVGSYRGDERSHTFDRGYALTLLPAEFYENYHTAMSSLRWPPVFFLNMPVPHHWN